MPKLQIDPSVVRHGHAVLFELYPALFDLTNPVPLKIGIRKDLQAKHPEMDPRFLNMVLGYVAHQLTYLERCVEGAVRYGFDGPDGTVTKAEAKHSKKWIKAHARRAARAAQETEPAEAIAA